MVVLRFAEIGLKSLMALLVLVSLWNLWRKRDSMTRSHMRRGLRYLKRRVAVIIVASMAFLAVYCGTQYFYQETYPRLVVSLNYEEAAKGLNPNKT